MARTGIHRGDVVLTETLETREELVRGPHSFADITNIVCRPAERTFKEMPIGFKVGFFIAASLLTMFFSCIAYLIWTGIGIWGNTAPVYWAWDIVNFVFWVGIGHAGTLISAILFLFRQKWRTSINRYAEAMTVFAVICALMFPGIHVGRFWTVY
ncbi:MAG TPA: hydrogenase, partial [Myxococcota bacterium]|nr:hydrogenase [Myxococcota bacterium]